MNKIVIFAGTGFIGTALVEHFCKTREVVVVGRTAAIDRFRKNEHELIRTHGIKTALWDGIHLSKEWTLELENAAMVINLAGKSVNCRYHAANKKAVLESRTITTALIGKAIQLCQHPPTLWINAGSSTIYADSYQQANDEIGGTISDLKKDNMPFSLLDQIRFLGKKTGCLITKGRHSNAYQQLDKDFSVSVCKAWEQSFWESPTPQTRKIALRIAIVLGSGGVMQPYRMLSLLGLGGKQGHGKQKFSWIHIHDLCRACEYLETKQELNGVFNLAAPEVVSNAEFCQTINHKLHRKIALPATAMLLELGAFLLGTETELILKSRWVKPRRLLDAGFHFNYTTLAPAIENILTNWKSV